MGDFVANFVRGRGDYMGVAGYLNDGYDATAPVLAIGQMILVCITWLVM